jgi:hypothetical protein
LLVLLQHPILLLSAGISFILTRPYFDNSRSSPR